MNLLIWTGEVALYWLFLYGFFYFFLRKFTHFKWNRAYLLGSLGVSLLLPFIEIPTGASEPIVAYTAVLRPATISPSFHKTDKDLWLQLLLAIYLAGVLVAGLKFAAKLLSLSRIWRNATPISPEKAGAMVYLLPDGETRSFSFFKKIGLSPEDNTAHYETIVAHEMVHVRQWHSLDIIITEILQIVFWFNPTIRLYRRSLQELHEFLVDRETGNRDAYARFLVTYTLNYPELSLVNNFFKASLLKQRIEMLYREKTSGWKVSVYAASGLITLLLAVAIAACTDVFTKEPVVIETNEKIFTAVEEVPEFPGGTAEMYRYLQKHIRYPGPAARANVQGKVFLQFVVTKEGAVKDIKVLKGIGFGCDTEAVRVIKNMPRWVPGRQKGQPVNVQYTLPVNFQLETAEEEVTKMYPPTISGADGVELKTMYVIGTKKVEFSGRPHPNDIKSVKVLDGQTAFKAYGEQGKNGVVEIQLKEIH